ncbi:MAG: hypothetical protein GY854_25060 [Deltaproteobacteria bacterium]|nr:hypothetical protein [Deltaproteobacteria bacterium]
MKIAYQRNATDGKPAADLNENAQMNKEERITAALDNIKVRENLLALAAEFKKEGMQQKEMYTLFDKFRAKHENDKDESKYDAVLDTMDFIAGWCSPKDALFDEYYSGHES